MFAPYNHRIEAGKRREIAHDCRWTGALANTLFRTLHRAGRLARTASQHLAGTDAGSADQVLARRTAHGLGISPGWHPFREARPWVTRNFAAELYSFFY